MLPNPRPHFPWAYLVWSLAAVIFCGFVTIILEYRSSAYLIGLHSDRRMAADALHACTLLAQAGQLKADDKDLCTRHEDRKRKIDDAIYETVMAPLRKSVLAALYKQSDLPIEEAKAVSKSCFEAMLHDPRPNIVVDIYPSEIVRLNESDDRLCSRVFGLANEIEAATRIDELRTRIRNSVAVE